MARVFAPDSYRCAKTVTTSRFTGQVIPRSGKQLTHIDRVTNSAIQLNEFFIELLYYLY